MKALVNVESILTHGAYWSGCEGIESIVLQNKAINKTIPLHLRQLGPHSRLMASHTVAIIVRMAFLILECFTRRVLHTAYI